MLEFLQNLASSFHYVGILNVCLLVLLYIGRVLSSHPQMLHHTFGKVTRCSRVSFDVIPYFLALMSHQWVLEMPSGLVPSGQLEYNALKTCDCFVSRRVCAHVQACVSAFRDQP